MKTSRKYFCLGAFIFCLPLACLSQRFHAGLTAGLSTSQVAGDELSGFNQAGLIAGAFANTAISDNFLLQMEMMYIQKGSKKPYQESNPTLYIMRLNYIEVPVLFLWKINSRFVAEGGPAFGFLVFSEEKDEYGVEEGRPEFNKMDFSACIGLQYKLSDTWSFTTRFSNSFVPIRGEAGGYSFLYFERGQYNTVLAFAFQYQF
jgi:hypothetical protein